MKPRMIDYYMQVAELTANLSRARRLQVGCVIVKDDNIISFGWNGTPPGRDNNCENVELIPNSEVNEFDQWPFVGKFWIKGQEVESRYRLVTKPEVLHAEQNALMKLCRTHESSQDASMFLTHVPCMTCAKLIASAGIKNVYYRQQYRDLDGLALAKDLGVQVHQV